MKTNYILFRNVLSLILGAFIFAFCLSSCEDFFETTIDIDPPAAVPKLVINTFINPNQDSIGVYVGRNYPLSSDINFDFDAIDAEVTLENLNTGMSVTIPKVISPQSTQTPFNYFNSDIDDAILDTSHEYQLTVRDISETFPVATSMVNFPSKSVITNTEYEYEGGIREDGDPASSFKITFNDPPEEKNFYEIGIIVNYSVNRPTNNFEYVSTIDLGATKGYEEDYVLLTDESFDGQEKEIELKIYRRSEDNNSYTLVWRNITEDYFRYSKTLRTQNDLGDNPFSSIAPVYTNVNNGLGIISFYQEQIIPLN